MEPVTTTSGTAAADQLAPPCPPAATQTSVDAAQSPSAREPGEDPEAASRDVDAACIAEMHHGAAPPSQPPEQPGDAAGETRATAGAPAAVVEVTIETGSAAAEEPGHAPPPPADGTGDNAPAFADAIAAPRPPPTCPASASPSQQAAVADAQAWVIDFAPTKAKPVRKMTKKEKDAIKESRLRSAQATTRATQAGASADGQPRPRGASDPGAEGLGADSEGNAVVSLQTAAEGAAAATYGAAPAALQVIRLDTSAADRDALVPTDLTTTRADLEARLVLRMPRLLCVNKQYPRGCGIASLTSVYNYLYSWLGESAVGADRPPHSQEEMMSILGFEPPFGEIAWGPFTGNATLVRWFHALNRHFGHSGRAYILYKAHGHGKTTHLYPDNTAALAAVKAALRDPHCALIYHCHNHYMVPIGYQDIPLAQSDFLRPTVSEANCETTVFIGEVSRGRHEAMYARKWSQIVKDIECKSPHFFNIRHPELGIQRREPKKKERPPQAPSPHHLGEAPASATVEQTPAQSEVTAGADAAVAVDAVVVASEDRAEAVGATTESPAAAPPADDLSGAAQHLSDHHDAGAVVPLPTLPVPGATAEADASDAVAPAALDIVPSVLPPIVASAGDAGDGEAIPTEGTAPPPPSTAAAEGEAVAAPPSAPASPPSAPKKERGNLHCIICFRNDEVEPRLERYEDTPTMRPPWMMSSSSSSSSSREGSIDSDADDGA